MKQNIEWDKAILIPEGDSLEVEFDSSRLNISHKSNRWLIDHRNPSTDKLLVKGSTQKIFASGKKQLRFIPALPPDPVVLKPGEEMFLMPNEKMKLYVNVPVWIMIFNGQQKPENLMLEVVTKSLSDIWFGEPQSGEKGFSLRFDESFLDMSRPGFYEINCPVEIHNASNVQLPFHRFALRTRHLTIYNTPQGLMTNETKIKFNHKDAVSEVVYVKKAPEGKSSRICEPREIPSKKLLGRSFSFTSILPVTHQP